MLNWTCTSVRTRFMKLKLVEADTYKAMDY